MMLFWLIFMMCSLFLFLFKNGLFVFFLRVGHPGSLPSTSSLHYWPLLRCLPDWQCTSVSLLAQKTRADREREHDSSQEGWVSKHHRCKRLRNPTQVWASHMNAWKGAKGKLRGGKCKTKQKKQSFFREVKGPQLWYLPVRTLNHIVTEFPLHEARSFPVKEKCNLMQLIIHLYHHNDAF